LLTLTAYWDRLFEKKWRQYGISSELLTLAEDADKEWPKLIGHFKHVVDGDTPQIAAAETTITEKVE